MNNQVPKTVDHDPDTGEVKNLPTAFQAGNQSLAVQLAMAELNQDIVTAKAYPRSPASAMRNILQLVMMDEKTAQECVYAKPRDGKTIRGPSVRLAEIIASQWGNCHTASRIVHVDKLEKYVESEGIFHDLETGMKRTARHRGSISKSNGALYSQDMIMTAGSAAASIAMREAILKGVPKAVWRPAYDHAEKVIRGDVTTLVERREDAMQSLAGIGVTAERVFAAMGVNGVEELDLDKLADLYTMYTGVKNGDTDVDDVFPAVRNKGDGPRDLKDRLGQIADGGRNNDQKKSASGDSPTRSDDAGKQSSSSSAASGKRPSSDQAPTRSGDGDPIAVAERRGRAAYRNGMRRERCLPVDYKAEDREDERNAFFGAYDAEAADDGPEPGSVEED
ncbi:hypothetical protein MAUB1S_11410 [Mycolicibacterium aubagnense]